MLLHAILKQFNDVTVVWILGEAQISAVIHELLELLRLVFTKFFNRNLLFLLLDVGILLCLRSTWEALPWKRPLQEVEEHMTDGFQVISSRLFVPNMSIKTCISCSSCQVLSISERDVLTIRALVALCQSKINDVDCVFGSVCPSDQKIVWFNVSMDNSLLMDTLDSLDHLNGNMKSRP